MNPTPHAPSTPPGDPRRLARPLPALAGAWLALALAGAARAEGPTPPPAAPALNLVGGGAVPGELVDSDRPGVVRWKSAAFASPFEFPLAAVESVRFPVGEGTPRPPGAFGFELAGGDLVFGALLALDEKSAELEVPRLGKVRLDRARLLRVFRWRDGADLIYNGPNGLAGWREVPMPGPRPAPKGTDRAQVAARPAMRIVNGVAVAAPPPAQPAAAPAGPKWREESGRLSTDREGACVRADLGLPARSSIEFELSWKDAPDFVLALGVGDDDKSAQDAFRFEAWDGQVVAYRETDGEADVAPIPPPVGAPGRLHLQAFLDQERGRLLVYSAGGDPVAELKVGARPGPALPKVLLASRKGDIRLERLRVARWDGETPRPSGAETSRVDLADGSVDRGSVDRLDPATGELVLKGEGGEARVPLDRVAGVRFARAGDDAPPAVRVVFQDGTRIGGDWVKADGGTLTLAAPGVEGPVRLALAGARSIDVRHGEAQPPEKDPLAGTLEMDGLRVPGLLVDSGEAGGLAWKPIGSEAAARLLPGASGRVVYRAPAPKVAEFRRPSTATVARPAVARPGLGGVLDAVQNALGPNQVPPGIPATPSGPDKKFLYLRTGDVIPARIVKIDEAGVTFQTDHSASTFVPNDRIKAVEMASEYGAAIRISKAKRERLLTLPRMQKESPPTHLIRSRNGDILRARIVGMDEKAIRVEVRLEEKEIPRDRVSRIIWLHPDEVDPSKKPADPAGAPAEVRVQAVRSDGIRMTFAAGRVEEGVLAGRSDVLGPCRVRLQDLDQLLIGGAVEKEATTLAYQQWKLQNAPEPKSAQDGDASGGAAGTESALVGKPAPDFTLDLLNGPKFHLAENRGQVIVLDFWATWCGPCIQAMPQVDEVTREFADKGVKLVAVNLQEAPAQVSLLLARLKLSPTVALDRDGAVAEKYGANAIPQTVVIDREGKVTRLFVGGGPRFGEQLREALQALMPPAKP